MNKSLIVIFRWTTGILDRVGLTEIIGIEGFFPTLISKLECAFLLISKVSNSLAAEIFVHM